MPKTKEAGGKKSRLDFIDQFIWKRGGLLYRIWFEWKPVEPEEKDEDTGAIMGRVNRRYFKNL